MIISKEQVDCLFVRNDGSPDTNPLLGLYKLLIDDWDGVDKLSGFPKAGAALHDYLSDAFVKHDMFFLWVNRGFSRNDNLDPWEVSLKVCLITRK